MARRGEIKGFTKIDDSYDPSRHVEITLDTISQISDQNARLILDYLTERGFVRVALHTVASTHNEMAGAEPGG